MAASASLRALSTALAAACLCCCYMVNVMGVRSIPQPKETGLLQPAYLRNAAGACGGASGPNPCAYGTCASSGHGSYTCICPPGFQKVMRSADGSSTCIVSNAPYESSYTASGLETCEQIALSYGLGTRSFKAQNQGLDCSRPLPEGVEVNVSSLGYKGCSSFFPIFIPGMTCASITRQLELPVAELQARNPGLDCSKLRPGMQLCIAHNAACGVRGCSNGAPQICTLAVEAQYGDTCHSLAAQNNMSLSAFYALNPGLSCHNLASAVGWSTAAPTDRNGQSKVCVQGFASSVPQNESPGLNPAAQYPLSPQPSPGPQPAPTPQPSSTCPGPAVCRKLLCPAPHIWYTTRPGDSCASIAAHTCGNNQRLLRALNPQLNCADLAVYGQVCVEHRPTLRRSVTPLKRNPGLTTVQAATECGPGHICQAPCLAPNHWHTIQKGETCDAVVARFQGGQVEWLKRINPQMDCSTIFIWEKVCI